MFARVTTVQMRPEKLDEAIQLYHDSVVPAAQAQKGFRSTYLLTDRATGRGMTVTYFETAEDIAASEANGYYQAQLDKFAPLFSAPPQRTVFEVGVEAMIPVGAQERRQ